MIGARCVSTEIQPKTSLAGLVRGHGGLGVRAWQAYRFEVKRRPKR